MILKNTYLIPGDKCGVFWVKTFHLYGNWKKRYSNPGEFIKVSVKNSRPESKLKKKMKSVGIIIRVKKESFKSDRSFLKFKMNNIILVKKRLTPRGKEIFGPILWRIKRRKFRSSFPTIL